MQGVDWQALDRLRSIFLRGEPVRGSYWKSRSDLSTYDATLGERIGWKWDAVLVELRKLGWTPPSGPLFDFGCGSGIAGRRVVRAFGSSAFSEVRVHDKSALAEEFALDRLRNTFSGIQARRVDSNSVGTAAQGGTLVVSHVLSEMTGAVRQSLIRLASHASAVIWVEPGTHADSHALVEVREALLPEFLPIAPCVHREGCGLLTAGNERHWCHFFAQPPWEIFADPQWSEFARRMGIDLRSLPYSYLVMERKGIRSPASTLPEDCTRILGAPRFYKGYAKVFGCNSCGVTEWTWPKRAGGKWFKQMKDGDMDPLLRLRCEGDQVQEVEPIFSSPETTTEEALEESGDSEAS